MIQHPLYEDYGFNTTSQKVVQISTNEEVPILATYSNGKSCIKCVEKLHYLHQFIWECCHKKVVKPGWQVIHIDQNTSNNNSSNLELELEGAKMKARKVERIPFADVSINAHKMKRSVKAINIDKPGEEMYFSSKFACGKYFGVSAAMIYLVCENKNCTMSAKTAKGRIICVYGEPEDPKQYYQDATKPEPKRRRQKTTAKCCSDPLNNQAST